MNLQDIPQTKMPRSTCTVFVSSYKKLDSSTGTYYSFGWISGELFSSGIVFSFEVKTGKIDFSGYPWESFQEDLKMCPYRPEIVEFLNKYSAEISGLLKEGCLKFQFNGTRWIKCL